MPGDRFATALLGLSIFATGFTGLVSEFILSTVSSYILGNSVEQFSVIIALMMLMMGLAGAIQRFFPDRHLIEQFVAVEALLALLGGFAPLAIYAADALMEHHFLLVLYAFVMALGFLIGFELPLVLRINARFVRRLPNNLAVILGLDYVGGFVGALIWTRFLLRELPLTEISFLLAGFNFFIAAVTFFYFGARRRDGVPGLRLPIAIGILIVALALALGYSRNRGWSEDLERRLYDDHIVFAETTRYQRIVITHDRTTDDYRLFLNGNLQLSSLDEAVYHEQLVHPAMSIAATRSRVLVLGGGDGLALREVLRWPDVEQVTLVDLDPRMTELASRHPVLVRLNEGAFSDARVQRLESPAIEPGEARPIRQRSDAPEDGGSVEVARVRVVNVDADRFVDGIPGLWDVVLIDFPDPSSVELVKLYSREFYRKLARVLAPGAVVAVQATSPYHAKEAFLCILRTIRSAGYSALPYQDNVPSFGSWGFVLAEARGAGPPALGQRVRAVEALPVATRYLTPELMHASLAFGRGRLESERDGINTLMRPVLLDLYLHASWLVE